MAARAPAWSIPGPVKVFIPGTKEAGHAGESIVHGAKGAEKGVEAVGQVSVSVAEFLGKLSDPHTWVRIGEVLVGTILLVVGIDHAFGTNYSEAVPKLAAKAAML